MISATNNVKKILYSNNTVRIGTGCLLEYNMNNMIDNITVEYNSSLIYPSADGINVYKKLFPVDSIVKPFRPVNSGVKYYIGFEDDTANADDNWTKDSSGLAFLNYKDLEYASFTKPRVYYSGLVNKYKYWVSPPSTDTTQYPANVTVNYTQSAISIDSAYSTGSKIVYKTVKDHGLTSNLKVKISGFTNSNFNFTSVGKSITIISYNEFYIDSTTAAASESGAGARLAQIVNDAHSSISTKPALANKIIIKFEKYHYIPSSTTVTITYPSGVSPSPIIVSSTSYSNGTLTLYWNGTSWSTTAPYSSSQPISWQAPKEIKSIQVVTSNAPANRLIAITEISARWVKDISSDIKTMNIQKEASASTEDLLPVGTITSNSIQLNIAKYDKTELKIIQYDRQEDWKATPNDYIYLYKDVEVIPHFIIYSEDGTITDGSLKYDRIEQGTFYIGDHDIQTYGDASINAFDGAKQLMQLIPTNLYLEDCPITSAIMCLLDSVGFTNYNINLSSNTDSSIPKLTAWWSDESRMVWDYLQELCRDAQINAFFDENNVLQFYSRDYIYNKTNIDWQFHESSGSSIVIGSDTVNILPNIIDFSKREIPSANLISVRWSPVISSVYNQDVEESLWSSPTSFIYAGGLQTDILSTTAAENIDFKVSAGDTKFPVTSTFNFSGYFLVNSEIFEYDAIEYSYRRLSDGTTSVAFIESKSQLDSIRSKSYQDPTTFQPTGRYRIKKRGVFNTKPANHYAAPSQIQGWNLKEYEWDQG